jgi:hypothetical protein
MASTSNKTPCKGGNESKDRRPKAKSQEQNLNRVTKGQSKLCFRSPLLGHQGAKEQIMFQSPCVTILLATWQFNI